MLEKGQFPRSLGEVINQLQRQDPEAGAKLADKTVKKIQAANILTNNEAGSLAQALLTPGPKLPATQTSTKPEAATPPQSQGRQPVLQQTAYVDLLSGIIDAALKATPQAQNNQRGQNNGRRGGIAAGPNSGQNNAPTPLSKVRLNKTTPGIVGGSTGCLANVDQYLRQNQPRFVEDDFGAGYTPVPPNCPNQMLRGM